MNQTHQRSKSVNKNRTGYQTCDQSFVNNNTNSNQNHSQSFIGSIGDYESTRRVPQQQQFGVRNTNNGMQPGTNHNIASPLLGGAK